MTKAITGEVIMTHINERFLYQLLFFFFFQVKLKKKIKRYLSNFIDMKKGRRLKSFHRYGGWVSRILIVATI